MDEKNADDEPEDVSEALPPLLKVQLYELLEEMRQTPGRMPQNELGTQCQQLLEGYQTSFEESLFLKPNLPHSEFIDALMKAEDKQLLAVYLPELMKNEDNYSPDLISDWLDKAIEECDEKARQSEYAVFLKAKHITTPATGEDCQSGDVDLRVSEYMAQREALQEEYAWLHDTRDCSEEFALFDKICKFHIITDQSEIAEEAYDALADTSAKKKRMVLGKEQLRTIRQDVSSIDCTAETDYTRMLTEVMHDYQQQVSEKLATPLLNYDSFMQFEQEAFDRALKKIFGKGDSEISREQLYEDVRVGAENFKSSVYGHLIDEYGLFDENGKISLTEYLNRKPEIDSIFLRVTREHGINGEAMIEQFDRFMQYQLFNDMHAHVHASVAEQVNLLGLGRRME